MSMVNSVSNLNEIGNIQNLKFGSEIALTPSLASKEDEVTISNKNKGKKLLLGAAVIAAIVGFRGKIANVINKYFPNFFKTVGEKFTTIRNAIVNFFKTHTPDKTQVTNVVNSAKENLTKGVNATKEGIAKGAATVKDSLTKTVTSAKAEIQEVSEKIKTKI